MNGEKIRVRFKKSNGRGGPCFYGGKEYEGRTNGNGSWTLINAKGSNQSVSTNLQREFDVLDEIPTGTYIWECTTRCNEETCHLVMADRDRNLLPPHKPKGCPWGQGGAEWILKED